MKKRLFRVQCAHVSNGCEAVGKFEKPAPAGWTCEPCEGMNSWDCAHGQRWRKDLTGNKLFLAYALVFLAMLAFGGCPSATARKPECPGIFLVCERRDEHLVCAGQTVEAMPGLDPDEPSVRKPGVDL